MNIGIIGMGTVGRALYEGFLGIGHEVFCNDVKELDSALIQNHAKERLVAECELIFICVDTPTNEIGCDLSKVYKAFNELHFIIAGITGVNPVIVIKSTVIPGTTDTLRKMYPYVCYNPEFLRVNNAVEDFINPDRIVIGGHSNTATESLYKLYETDWNCPIFSVRPLEAELIKYLSNAFLVTKVAFSQEINHISQMLGIDANLVYRGIITDRRINQSHLDPQLGPINTGSPCLPKDLKALIMQLDRSGYDSHLLKSVYAKGIQDARLTVKLEIETCDF